MLGDSLLVAPKITTPDSVHETIQQQEVTFNLPPGEKWYNHISGKVETEVGNVTRNLGDLEQAVFVKGGSVIPTLLHDDCYALTKCIADKIRLDVYLDNDSKATGTMYTDDGKSFKHETNNEYAIIDFNFDGGFTSKIASTEATYTFPKSQTIDSVSVYGLSEEPNTVLQDGQQVPDFAFMSGVALIAMPNGVAPD